MKVTEFAREMATAATGTDCEATAAWLGAYMADYAAWQRACLIWERATEAQQEAMACHMGMTDGRAEFPFCAAMRRDMDKALELAMEALA